MRRLLFLLAFAFPLFAADYEVGIRHVMTTPRGETGALEIVSGRGFGASAEVFFTDNVSAQAVITLINPAAFLGDTDLGTLGIKTSTLGARWHFAPHARWSGFAGAGGAFVQLGDLDDQFGDAVDVRFDSETAFFGEAGLRFRFRPHLYIEGGVTYMPLDITPDVRKSDVPFPATISLDPMTIAVSAAWRF